MLEGRLHDKNEDLKDLEYLYQTLKTKLFEQSEKFINRMMTELNTGGNIRFEDGK